MTTPPVPRGAADPARLCVAPEELVDAGRLAYACSSALDDLAASAALLTRLGPVGADGVLDAALEPAGQRLVGYLDAAAAELADLSRELRLAAIRYAASEADAERDAATAGRSQRVRP